MASETVSLFEIGSAALSLPPTGVASVLSLGSGALSLLWLSNRGTPCISGSDPLARFESAAGLAVVLLEADATERAAMIRALGEGIRPHMERSLGPNLLSELRSAHGELADGIAAAFCRGGDREGPFREGRRLMRTLMQTNGHEMQPLFNEAQRHWDRGVYDAVHGALDARCFVRDACYRAGVEHARALDRSSRIAEARHSHKRLERERVLRHQVGAVAVKR